MRRTLGTFTGIGGLTHALHGLAVPTRALARLMEDGRLPRAPVCPDARQLGAQWLRDQHVAEVEMLVGGFFCVGFSSCGSHKGFANGKEQPVRRDAALGGRAAAVPGNKELADLCWYELRWCVPDADAVCPPQLRRHWYCLAVRPGFRWTLPVPSAYTEFGWAAEGYAAAW